MQLHSPHRPLIKRDLIRLMIPDPAVVTRQVILGRVSSRNFPALEGLALLSALMALHEASPREHKQIKGNLKAHTTPVSPLLPENDEISQVVRKALRLEMKLPLLDEQSSPLGHQITEVLGKINGSTSRRARCLLLLALIPASRKFTLTQLEHMGRCCRANMLAPFTLAPETQILCDSLRILQSTLGSTELAPVFESAAFISDHARLI